MPFYEYHDHANPEFKIIFHKDYLQLGECNALHWHSSPEFLLVTEGEISVNCDGSFNSFKRGEMAVINSNQLHQVFSRSESSAYYCIILDESICFDFPALPYKSTDRSVTELYGKIISETEAKKPFYREAVIGYSKALYSLLCRSANNTENMQKPAISTKKATVVKEAAQFINENFQRDISLELIAQTLNINKYYLSHIFKEISGSTLIEHINFIRCKSAKAMLKSGKYTVSECCYLSGFSNPSYFSKTYKKIMGHNPAIDLASNTDEQ